MSKYCPECKNNFSDAFDEWVYCGSELVEGTIETEDIQTDIYNVRFRDIRKVF